MGLSLCGVSRGESDDADRVPATPARQAAAPVIVVALLPLALLVWVGAAVLVALGRAARR